MPLRHRSWILLILALAVLVTSGSTSAKDGRKPRKHADDVTVGRGSASGRALPSGISVGAPTRQSGPGQQLTGASTLVLYDTSGPYGWLGELYGMMAANLVSHFGSWTAHPVNTYTLGELSRYTGVVYIGSTYDEPLPVAFLSDVAGSSKPVVWAYDNIWQLTSHVPDFAIKYGWNWSGFDTTPVNGVLYKGELLKRYVANAAGIMNYSTVGFTAQAPAWAMRTDGTSFPWAVRSNNLTYIGENPLAFIGEGDRYLAFADLLFDALAPTAIDRHRALVRIEDVGPTSDPVKLRAIADYLFSRKVPFSVGVFPRWTDPLGFYNGGVAETIVLKNAPTVVAALKYMQQKGGTIIEHGWTHQYRNISNPYGGASGDDFEFYRVTENADHSLTYVGPVPEDSTAWANNRFKQAANDFRAARLSVPSIFEFPHYAASAIDYTAVAKAFSARYERSLYFRGVLSGTPIDHSRFAGQQFPFVVRDVYGSLVLPENLGAIEPDPWFIFPARLPAEIVDDARRARVVRDGFASFFFHPFLDLSYLKATVEGIQTAGYTFVSPSQALGGTTFSTQTAVQSDTSDDDDDDGEDDRKKDKKDKRND